jgi:histidine kinase
MRVLARNEHPLVLLMDDLQWAEEASLELIRLIVCDPELKYLLVIGTWRTNEADDPHPLPAMVEAIKQNKGTVNTLALKPLSVERIQALLSDSLQCGINETAALAEIVARRTGAIPLCIQRLLVALHERGHLFFDPESGRWQWRIDSIRRGENFAGCDELLDRCFGALPAPLQALLQVAACIGMRFNPDMARSILSEGNAVPGPEPAEPSAELNAALTLGYLHSQTVSGCAADQTDPDPRQLPARMFQFTHERLHHAAYTSLSRDQRNTLHGAGQFPA